LNTTKYCNKIHRNVALIFLYKCCKFGEKICNNSRDIDFFLGDYYFLARPVQISSIPNDTYLRHCGSTSQSSTFTFRRLTPPSLNNEHTEHWATINNLWLPYTATTLWNFYSTST